ncbi:putative membrane protein [Mucilaginibacter sp. OAE612]|uniref:DoxX family protein n=1 Tax=Mucilaginibacter sp. OAE612 TaxID=3156444 RepID=UPI00359E5F86
MKVLLVLIISFILTAVISRLFIDDWNIMLSGNVAMMLMLWFASLGHFMFTKGMVMMMPPFIPFKVALVYLTGVMEIILGALLIVNATRHIAGIILLVMFAVMLPANINAAIKHVDLEKATYDGSGPGYLWFRIPLQLLFIAWILYFSVGI